MAKIVLTKDEFDVLKRRVATDFIARKIGVSLLQKKRRKPTYLFDELEKLERMLK